MTRFADELRGGEGERCTVFGLRNGDVIERDATVIAVHDGGQSATVRYDDDQSTETLTFERIDLEGDEA